MYTVPKRECHGLFLATCGVSNMANLLCQLKLPLTKVFIFCDAIAHIIALKKSPACFQLPYSRLYAEINALTFQIGNLTSQLKEDIVRFLHQKVYSNPADLLSKFDLEHDSVDSWILKSQMLFRPPWLQKHPHEYLPNLLKISNEQMALQAAGGDENIFKITESTPDLLAPTNRSKFRNVDNSCCYIKYVLATDELPAKKSIKNNNYELVTPLF